MRTLFHRFYLLTLAVTAFFFCPPTVLQAEPAALPPLEEMDSPTPAYTRYLEVVKTTRLLREARDTKGLESLANELRSKKEALDGGTWILSHFYQEAVLVPGEDAGLEKEAMDFYRGWVRDNPESITARICLAEALTDSAWNARGSGYADTVSNQGWKLFRERLEEARMVLTDARTLKEECPHLYAVAQTIGLGQGWSREKYFGMVEEAIRKEPTYGTYYTRACYFLFPRWHGEPGDWEKWIKEKADAYPAELSDKQYARFIWMADVIGFPEEIQFSTRRLDWKRAQRGFESWLAEAPDNHSVRFEYLRMALLANDRKTAAKQFDVTGGKFWPALWKDRRTFEAARLFAYAEGANPLRKNMQKQTPARIFSPRAVTLITTGFNVVGGFFGGLIAGILALLMAWRYRRPGAGVVALLSCLVLAMIFGTLAALVPAYALFLYFLLEPIPALPELKPLTPGRAFLNGFMVMGVYIGLVFFAVIFAAAAMIIIEPDLAKNAPVLLERLYSDGTAARIMINSTWISLLFLILLCGRQRLDDLRGILGLNGCRSLKTAGYFVAAALATGVLGFALDQVVDVKTKEAMVTTAKGLQSPVLFWLGIGVFAPVLEELLFRGYLFHGWLSKWGAPITILATSFFFTLMHVQYGWVGLLQLFILALALGILRWKTNSVIPCILLHMLNNVASIFFL